MDKARILIVEDERLVAADLAACLKHAGHEVVGASATGPEAVELASQTRPDLVLMDIMLEGAMDGITTAAALRAACGVSVVYLTAFCDEPTLQRAKVTEPLGYVLKPFEESLLRITIEMALYRQKVERERARLHAELEEALQTVKRLSGLLSICAQCKKIRDNQGDWIPLEVFISNNADVNFSHGFCPICYHDYVRKEGLL